MNEKEIELSKLTTDLTYLERKNIQLRGEIQCLNDRIAGLVKENDTLKREASIRKVITRTFNEIAKFVVNIQTAWSKFKNQSIEKS